MTWSDDPGERPGDDAAVADLLLPPADARTGPARRVATAVSTEAYLAAVDEALRLRREDERAAPAPKVAAAPRWRRQLLVAAATLLFAFSLGASAVALRIVDIRLGVPEVTPAPAPEVARPPPRPQAAPPRSSPPPTLAEAPLFEVDRRGGEAPAPRPVRRPPRDRTERPREVRVASEQPVVVPESLPPEDLLARANAQRLRREWRAADAFYGAVVTRFPGTDAAVVAEVAAATLHLQRLGDATGALAAYRHALGARPSGPLAEDARWGIAEAHRALGDARGEAGALREFVERHPQSELAPAARRRLERLAP